MNLWKSGYQVGRQIIEVSEINRMRDYLMMRLDRLREQFQEWIGEKEPLDCERYCYHSDRIREYEQQGLPKNLRHFLTGEFDLETRLSPEIRQFVSVASLQPTISELLGESSYFFHYPPMLRFKISRADNTLVPPHQDIAYNTHLDRFMTIWIPFTSISDEVGGVVFYEGTQNLGILPHGASGAWSSRALFDESDYATFSPEMEVGDVLFFTPTIVHTSGLNLSQSGEIRLSCDVRAFSQKTISPKAYYDPFAERVYHSFEEAVK
jgi:Phytanoyl-CoA dioxygenase (PhyH)